MTAGRARPPADALIVSLGVAALVCATLATHHLVPVDETRYAAVAWEMWRRADLLVPFLNGEPYSHKPPLLFWLLHAGWAAFGVNDWWPRILPGVIALCALGLVVALGRRLWPAQPGVAALAATLTAGAALWSFLTPVLMFDVLLAATVLLALLGVALAAGGAGRGWLLAGVGLGLGVLTKGPVTLLHVLPVALLAPLWAPFPARGWGRWYAGIAAAIGVAALIALAWAVPAALRGGDSYAQAIFWDQSAGRVVEAFAHQRPWWWYLPWLPVALFPWALWPPLWRAAVALRRAPADSGTRFCLAWALPALAAFMAVSGKQLHYLMPLLPAAMLAASRALHAGDGRPAGIAQAPVVLVVVVLGGFLMLAPVMQPAHGWPAWVGDIPAAGALGLMVLGLVLLAPPGPWPVRSRARVLAVAQLAITVLLIASVLAPAAPWYDTRPAGRFLHAAESAGRPIAHVGKYHGQFHFAGRLTRPLVVLAPDEAARWARAHPDGVVVAYRETGGQPGPVEFSQPYRGKELVVYAAALVAERPQLVMPTPE